MTYIKKIFYCAICAAFAGALCSCPGANSTPLRVWTDAPEFVLYAQLFNASQPRYKIEVRQTRNLARELETAAQNKKNQVDIAAGKWLKTAALAPIWRKTNFLFTQKTIQKKMFYQPLLDFGKKGNDQLLLPVSFNLGAFVFLPDAEKSTTVEESQTFITLDEIQERGIAFNQKKNGIYTRMGFSPTWNWNADFLYAAAALAGAHFEEDAPLRWNEPVFNQVITDFKTWLNTGNGGVSAEDDFTFKYSYDHADRLIDNGRILFAYIKSNSFFTLPFEERIRLDFRWFSGPLESGNKIPVLEDVIMLGITKKCRALKAAQAFVKWFYSEHTQRDLLVKHKDVYINSTVFGICNGFSAVRPVTETIFPQVYPAFLSHIPPEDLLLPPPSLPAVWPELKERVVVPYIRESVKAESPVARNLNQRLADWLRVNKHGLQFQQ